MDTRTFLQPEMTVEDVLKNWPGTSAVFLKGKSDCIGCFLQKFCTLREVSNAYQVSPEDFMEELERHIQTINLPQRS